MSFFPVLFSGIARFLFHAEKYPVICLCFSSGLFVVVVVVVSFYVPYLQ